ncbi:RDD family protein [Brevundimonas sp.]|uniref:RDD family protein n=1 Tax=Brevundimonas sp. TaxID=1871086 RepID=UPI003AF5C7BA
MSRASRTTSGSQRTLVTPEGVDLRLHIANAGQRLGAFLLDVGIIVLVLVVVTLVAGLMGLGAAVAGGMSGAEVMFVIWLLAFFVLRNFYFTAFELSPAGATPGKRLMGLRVAARDGGRLKSESVFARNAMRELEVFVPLSLIVTYVGQDRVDGWIALLTLVWASIFVLFPLFNHDRLRAGDLIGGTWVIRTPGRKLMKDMADESVRHRDAYAFTTAQLDAYGVHELQVLETVLRQNQRATLRVVGERIEAKIGWKRTADHHPRDFLSAYYAALRERLEQRLLMGVRRRDKHDV